MKHFTWRHLQDALDYAAAGGQAVHTHRFIVDWRRAPACFRREVAAGRDIAHLFDQDVQRLEQTARILGVRVLLVEHRGGANQHIDLCGGPLRLALAQCRQDN